MNEEAFNLSLRKFLKRVGVNGQREIELAVREAIEAGRLQGNEHLPVKVTLEFGPRVGAEGPVNCKEIRDANQSVVADGRAGGRPAATDRLFGRA
jgi:hypothetical protein